MTKKRKRKKGLRYSARWLQPVQIKLADGTLLTMRDWVDAQGDSLPPSLDALRAENEDKRRARADGPVVQTVPSGGEKGT